MIFEEYSLALTHVEKLLDRRQAITSFYLSVNAAIATVIGFLLRDVPFERGWLAASILILLVAGLGACWIWRSLLKQYAHLLRWWYAQLREIETTLDPSARLITREYEEFYSASRGGGDAKRISMTQREVALNWIISGIYAVFGVGVILVLLLK